ncbi:MAG: hypothetical protein ABFS16_01780 [Bacteroidota bacterium]
MDIKTIIVIVGLVCAVWVIFHVWKLNKDANLLVKIIWTILAVVFNIFTAIIYYLLLRNKKIRKKG